MEPRTAWFAAAAGWITADRDGWGQYRLCKSGLLVAFAFQDFLFGLCLSFFICADGR